MIGLHAVHALEEKPSDDARRALELTRFGGHLNTWQRRSHDAEVTSRVCAGVPAHSPRWTRQNVLCIDTGVHVPDYGHLTIAQIESGEPQGHRFARREGLAMSARDDG